ncbi:hypothetical protein QJQ45_018412 [Haematococcus lacustris]|nr:hypothetical protein QJQ45_018412 [Haematococcus lacustris]
MGSAVVQRTSMSAVSALVLLVAVLCLAQGRGADAQRGLPPGSYTRSCSACNRVASMPSILFCICTTKDGKTAASYVATGTDCPNIGNCDGQLYCLDDCAAAKLRPAFMPQGPYTTNCTGCNWLDSSTFFCEACRNEDGQVQATSLTRANTCTQLYNCNGRLSCRNPALPGTATADGMSYTGVTLKSGSNPGAALMDKLYGTRLHTAGAELQLPRKIPMRVEPKSYFALERTFLSWAGMAITMGGVSSVLVNFTNTDATSPQGQAISKRTIDIITCIYTPIAMLIMFYGLWTYKLRSSFMHKKQVGMLGDLVGPTIIASLVMVTLLIIFAVALYDVVY